MRRSFRLLATSAAEVAAVFAGTAPAGADTTAPEPVAVAQSVTARAEPPANPTSTDPVFASTPEPVQSGPVDSPLPVETTQPTVIVRTGRAGDPAAPATSLTNATNGTAGSSSETTRRAIEPTATAPSSAQPRGSERVSSPTPTPLTPTTQALTTQAPTTQAPTAETPVPARSSGAASHVVVAGENLWGIAAARLGSVTGRDVAALTTAEIVRYWVRVCENSRAHLRSGDVSLIYAGEIVELPALPSAH